MPSLPRIAFIAVCLLASAHAFAGDNPATPPPKTSDKQPPEAKSHDELGRLVCAAIDQADYEAVAQLMAPASLLKETGASEKKLAAYAEYLSGIPKLARQYRAWLQEKGLLPLAGKKLQKFEDNGSKQLPNGKLFQYSAGILVVNEKGTVLLELVDQAVAFDGRWYVGSLCMEGLETEFKPVPGKVSDDGGPQTKKPN